MNRQGRGLQAYAIFYLLFLYAADHPAADVRVQRSGTIIAFSAAGGDAMTGSGRCGADATLRGALTNSLTVAVASSHPGHLFWHLCGARSTRFVFPGKGGMMGFIMLPMVLPEISWPCRCWSCCWAWGCSCR